MLNVLRLFFLLVFAATLVPTPASAEKRELRLGVISAKPVEMIQKHMPLLNYLIARLEPHGIEGGRVIVARNLDEMLVRIRQGKVDLVFESAFSTVIMEERAKTLPTLLVWRKGVREYTTVFFTRADSPVKDMDDLAGRTIVFEDPKSTSAFAVPLAELKLHGLEVAPASKGRGPKTVNYVFAGEEINQAFFVLQKKADAGAFSSNDWQETPEKIQAELRVFHETEPILRYLVSFHPSLPKKLRTAIEDIMVRMEEDRAGRDALNRASGVKKIERLTARDRKSLRWVKNLTHHIEQQEE